MEPSDEETADDEAVEAQAIEPGADEPAADGPAADGPVASEDDTGLDIMVAGADPGVEGVDPSVRERAESGLQDTLDLRDWKMPSVRDYFWYLFVYSALIALAVYVIWNYRMMWAYVLWGGYLVIMLVLAGLILRSMNYRRGTYSKAFVLATLELQQAIEDAAEDVGLAIEGVEQPQGAFLRPMIATYSFDHMGFTLNVEGRPHLKRKVVRVGRFPDRDDLIMGRKLIDSLDDMAEQVSMARKGRSLFHEEGMY